MVLSFNTSFYLHPHHKGKKYTHTHTPKTHTPPMNDDNVEINKKQDSYLYLHMHFFCDFEKMSDYKEKETCHI